MNINDIVVIGDSYSAAREGDTGLDRGWPALLGIPPANRQAISGSTAAQWAVDQNGILTKAKNTAAGTLIVSMLGNDAFAIEGEISNRLQAGIDAYAAYNDFTAVLKAMARQRNYILLYPDPFSGQRPDFNQGLPFLDGVIDSPLPRQKPNVPPSTLRSTASAKVPASTPKPKTCANASCDPKRDHHRLFTFLNVNRMPPTNNYAEQTLRHPVIFRKLIFGNRSERGAHSLAVNLSLIHTAKCLQRDLIPLLKIALLSGSVATADFLFENSS
jgi:hypothetical protein